MLEIFTKPLTANDNLDGPLALLYEVFGQRADLSDLLKDWLLKPSVSAFVALLHEEVVGISVANTESNERLRKYQVFGPRAYAFLSGQKVGNLETLAMKPGYRKQGIGGVLAKAHLKWLKELGCTVVIGVSWNCGLPDNSKPLFSKGGFTLLGEAQEYYREASRKNHHRCPVCQGECFCSASLYGLILRPSNIDAPAS